MNNSKKLLIPFIATLVGALLIVLTLFLPYASATDETRQGLAMMSSMTVSEDGGITAGEVRTGGYHQMGGFRCAL